MFAKISLKVCHWIILLTTSINFPLSSHLNKFCLFAVLVIYNFSGACVLFSVSHPGVLIPLGVREHVSRSLRNLKSSQYPKPLFLL